MMDGQTRREAEGKRREEQEKELQVVLLRLQNEYRNQDIVSVISQHGTSQVDRYLHLPVWHSIGWLLKDIPLTANINAFKAQLQTHYFKAAFN